MGAQIHHEIKKDKDEVVFVIVEGVPVVEGANPSGLASQDAMGSVVPAGSSQGAPPLAEEMAR